MTGPRVVVGAIAVALVVVIALVDWEGAETGDKEEEARARASHDKFVEECAEAGACELCEKPARVEVRILVNEPSSQEGDRLRARLGARHIYCGQHPEAELQGHDGLPPDLRRLYSLKFVERRRDETRDTPGKKADK